MEYFEKILDKNWLQKSDIDCKIDQFSLVSQINILDGVIKKKT